MRPTSTQSGPIEFGACLRRVCRELLTNLKVTGLLDVENKPFYNLSNTRVLMGVGYMIS